MWRRLLDSPPRGVHAFLLEGTTLSRESGASLSEQQVEQRLAALCGQTPGMVLAFYSGHNIDRLVSVYRAAKRTGRELVLDLYGAAIAAATDRATIPQAGWEGVRVFVSHAQRRHVIQRGTFEDIDAIAANRIYPEEMRARAGQLVMTTRGSMTRDLDRANCLSGAHAVWSMWPGYLNAASGKRLCGWLDGHDIPLTRLHASGHATPADLAALATAVAPDRVVPIHTAAPQRYKELYEGVEVHGDGAWWSV